MKKIFLKFALLALVAVGMLSISSCKKDGDNLVGTWKCTDGRYSQSGTLQLVFKDDNTVIGINNTGQLSIFDDLNATYEYKDNYLYLDGIKADSLTFLSDDEINIFFLGGINDCGECPSREYNFRRIGGVK